jgi:xanthine dehydrogenase YagS FAD-binding subunit
MTGPVTYTRVADPDAAKAAFASGPAGATDYVAGGTDLIPLTRDRLRAVDHVVDINHLPMQDISETPRGLSIGSLARMQDVADHPVVRDGYGIIAEAVLTSASAQIRHMASIGGNLLQRTRCGYFRDPGFPCNKRLPGSGCPARTGENRLHAILGTSEACVATHASDLAVALVALDAAVELDGPGGRRTVPIGGFYRLPGDTPHIETLLDRGELIVAVHVPRGAWNRNAHYLKLRDRASFDFALVAAAVALHCEGGTIVTARIAAGGVGTIPWRLPAVEQALRERPMSTETYRAAALRAAEDARPLAQNGFKVELLRRAIVRALDIAGRKGQATAERGA